MLSPYTDAAAEAFVPAAVLGQDKTEKYYYVAPVAPTVWARQEGDGDGDSWRAASRLGGEGGQADIMATAPAAEVPHMAGEDKSGKEMGETPQKPPHADAMWTTRRATWQLPLPVNTRRRWGRCWSCLRRTRRSTLQLQMLLLAVI